MIYPDGHRRYRVIDDGDDNETVLESFDTLYEAEVALCVACNNDIDAFLMDAQEMYLE